VSRVIVVNYNPLTLARNSQFLTFGNKEVWSPDFDPIDTNIPVVIHKSHWIVPFEKNRCFTGRETELTQLEKMLFIEDRITKITVSGLGGVGKTSLTIELVYSIREHHKDCSIFWIPVTNFESL